MSLADVDADTRQLVLAADVVVGFQTTALYEAVASRRPVVYAAWGDAYERFRSQLIPFDHAPPDCLRHAGSAEALANLLVGAAPPPASACRAWYEDALGAIDGHATERVAARLAAVVADWPVTEERRDLELRRRRFAAGLLVRSLAAEAVWTAGLPVARVAGRRQAAELRRSRARRDRAMAVSTLRNGPVGGG